MRRFALAPALCALVAASSIAVADEPAGRLKAGGMEVRLDRFTELADGRVQAEMTFQNLSSEAPASVALKPARGNAVRDNVQLINAAGTAYRLVELSQFGENGSGDEWTRVEAGGSTAVTATFAPNGAKRGVQPFALTVPVRMVWRTGESFVPRTGTFDVAFRGLQKFTPREEPPVPLAAPQAPVLREEVSLPPATVEPPVVAPKIETAFTDDLAPRIAKLAPARPNPHAYLFAVGAEQYDDAPSVPYADRSARAMSELLKKRYGVPDENVTLITGADATGMKILGRLNSMLQRLTAGDTVYFYYAGHGLSGRDGNNVYVVPKDAVPGAYEVEMLSLAALVKRFEASPAARVVAFLDTCFSGRVGQKESLFSGVSPLVPSALPTPVQSSGKTTLFLAGQSYQFANEYSEHGHRLFSYYLMKGLLNGTDDARALGTYVATEVRRVSSKRGAEYLQEPQLQGVAGAIGENRKPQRAAK